jgi:hypothetical protein
MILLRRLRGELENKCRSHLDHDLSEYIERVLIIYLLGVY